MTYSFTLRGVTTKDTRDKVVERMAKHFPRLCEQNNDFLKKCGIAPADYVYSDNGDNSLDLKIRVEDRDEEL